MYITDPTVSLRHKNLIKQQHLPRYIHVHHDICFAAIFFSPLNVVLTGFLKMVLDLSFCHDLIKHENAF